MAKLTPDQAREPRTYLVVEINSAEGFADGGQLIARGTWKALDSDAAIAQAVRAQLDAHGDAGAEYAAVAVSNLVRRPVGQHVQTSLLVGDRSFELPRSSAKKIADDADL